jgi:hypothetical protein
VGCEEETRVSNACLRLGEWGSQRGGKTENYKAGHMLTVAENTQKKLEAVF